MKHSRRNVLFPLLIVLFGSFAFGSSVHAAANVAGATLSIPALKLQVPIIEANQTTTPDGFTTWDLASLGNRVAHLDGTSWLGDGADKNIVLAGHNTLPNGKAAIFYSLHRLHVGDTIILSQGDQTFTYAVTQAFLVDPSRFDLVYPTGKDQLTLLTCAGAFNAKSGVYAERLVIIAERVG
jgi:LPXTG-site transpeptidase (sortase) family protein